ncbi:DpnD/PcfM-like protein [uncultured Caudovirales phage]|uniref:DpnD/PcfM-like protein n=1 Tax=uncultured Caudovirales phage TaxID=2100421 RepID=A0A6J5L8E3_9CAUD|nr:DpnD/PcfM-like protein [uncultured Caudovirales phage]
MPKYIVNVYETLQHTVTVEADNEYDAREAGYDVVMNDTGDFVTESLETTETIASLFEEN